MDHFRLNRSLQFQYEFSLRRMCGITAIFHSDSATCPSVDVLEADLQVSLEAIQHRGPDSRGTYTSPDGRAGVYSFVRFK